MFRVVLRRGFVFLIRATSHDLKCVIRQRPLQCPASSHGARIHTSRSSSVVRITGIALGWIGSTTALGAVVRKP
jgi:uncharacterized Zn-binding protein involved in type VI secretion